MYNHYCLLATVVEANKREQASLIRKDVARKGIYTSWILARSFDGVVGFDGENEHFQAIRFINQTSNALLRVFFTYLCNTQSSSAHLKENQRKNTMANRYKTPNFREVKFS